MKEHEIAFIPVASVKLGKNFREDVGTADPKTPAGEKYIALRTSIKHEGLLQPIVVATNGKGYTLVAGNRRFHAVKDLIEAKTWKMHLESGEPCIPAIVLEEAEEKPQNGERILKTLAENAARVDLAWYELAEGAYAAHKEGIQQGAIASAIGLSKGYVSKLVNAKEKIRPKHWDTLVGLAKSGVNDLPVGAPTDPNRPRKSILKYAESLKDLPVQEQDLQMANSLSADVEGGGKGENGKAKEPKKSPGYSIPAAHALELAAKLRAASKDPKLSGERGELCAMADLLTYMVNEPGRDYEAHPKPWPFPWERAGEEEPKTTKRGPKKGSKQLRADVVKAEAQEV